MILSHLMPRSKISKKIDLCGLLGINQKYSNDINSVLLTPFDSRQDNL